MTAGTASTAASPFQQPTPNQSRPAAYRVSARPENSRTNSPKLLGVRQQTAARGTPPKIERKTPFHLMFRHV